MMKQIKKGKYICFSIFFFKHSQILDQSTAFELAIFFFCGLCGIDVRLL